ncbi:hypothetical protein [Rhizomonospora bruguierae]|uniref:hypothetical protein n=1 Tax=Rhizomonospora bruguierae TaxID=1581705 RepID=UPI001BCE6340|nr:hypothetical protein [Micromonospora sp. NBRC 107566]
MSTTNAAIGCYAGTEVIAPTRWNGGTTSESISAPYCTQSEFAGKRMATEAGQEWTKRSARAQTFAAGANVGPINVSATSGYSSNVDIYWKFSRASQLCGNTDMPLYAKLVYSNI